jgi:hypothetical protein
MSLPYGWAIQSVDGPEEVIPGSNLDIKPGTDVTDLRIVVTDRTSTLVATVIDEASEVFSTGWVLLRPRTETDLDPLGWGFRATQGSRGSNYTMATVLPGSYLAIAIDVPPHHLSGDADLMERARAAAVVVEIREGQTPLRLRLVRLQPFVRSSPN